MTLTKDYIIKHLPVYRDKWITVKSKQAVPDIINSIVTSHYQFADHYDKIAHLFAGPTLWDTCNNLFYFCKDNIRYKEESEDSQSTAIPAGILVRGYGDCKHYASFVAGCLSALKRQGVINADTDVTFSFASYKKNQTIPYHVFVIAKDKDGEIWIDPTPGAEKMTPVYWINKTV